MLFPPAVEAAEIMPTSELEELVETTTEKRDSYGEYPADWNVVIIDNRSEEEYQKGHINGAINMAADEAFAPCELPEDQDTKLIFYGQDAHDCVSEAKDEGYDNVYIYEAGVEAWDDEWGYLTTTPEYVASLTDESHADDADTDPYLIIDTRGFGMFVESHVPAAQAMEHTIFEEKYLDHMPADKETEIITYCGGFF